MTAPFTTDTKAMPTYAHRRSTDSLMEKFRTFSTSVLPPALAVYFAGLVGKVVLLDKEHDFNWPMVTIIVACLAAAFGPKMFCDWLNHKETMGAKE